MNLQHRSFAIWKIAKCFYVENSSSTSEIEKKSCYFLSFTIGSFCEMAKNLTLENCLRGEIFLQFKPCGEFWNFLILKIQKKKN